MSNLTNDDKQYDSRTSFVTVSSMIESYDRENNTIKLKSENENENKNSFSDLLSPIKTTNERELDLNQLQKESFNKLQNESLISISMSQNRSRDKFEDLPLQYTSSEKNKKNVMPHLVVEDKGEKRDYLGSYKNYEISKINEKNEKSILCFRRYDNFDNFYKKLKKKYPYHLVPRLIGKNALTKIITIDNEFYNKRKRQLNYFLNYLCNHTNLKDSKEFLKFLNDPEFDEEYFKKEENLFYFPESSKSTESISNKIYGVFSNLSSYFTHNEEIIRPSEQENKIKKMEYFYKKLFENFREIKNHMSVYIFNTKKSSENYSELANNFFYLKDVVFENINTKDIFIKYSDLSNDLVKINKNYFLDIGIYLDDKFEGFLSVLSGLCDTFDRYNEFYKSFLLVYKAQSDSKINNRNYNKSRLYQEWRSVKELKNSFETGIEDEIKFFIEKYSKEYSEILENYKLLIKYITTNELETIKKYSKILCLNK